MVKQQIQRQHRHRQHHGQRHVALRHGQHAAEHIVVHIRGHAGGAGNHQNTDGQRRRADGGNGGVAVPMGMACHPQQEKGCQNHHGDGEVQGCNPQRHGNRQRAEGDMAQPVADHGVALQHQRDAQQRGAQAYQNPGSQCPLHKGIGKHLQNIHDSSSSRKRRPWGLAK